MNSAQKQQKNGQDRICNCRNSKCMKLYCQCFAAGLQCTKQCRCIDCHNQKDSDNIKLNRTLSGIQAAKPPAVDGARGVKGCSCRKSFCIKKYCECFQEGLLCTQNCKCIDCQNNQSMTNRNVLQKLKKTASNGSNKYCTVYPLVLTTSAEHMENIVQQKNILNINDKTMEQQMGNMAKLAQTGQIEPMVRNFINILKNIESQASVTKIQVEQEVMAKEEENQ